MRLLFIKLKHIGDSLLLTPTLMAVRRQYPQARICVVVRKGCEGILEGCPAINQIFVSAAPEATKRHVTQLWTEMQLIRTLRREDFDYAFELSDGDRGRLLAFLSGAKTRCANQVGTQIGMAGPPPVSLPVGLRLAICASRREGLSHGQRLFATRAGDSPALLRTISNAALAASGLVA